MDSFDERLVLIISAKAFGAASPDRPLIRPCSGQYIVSGMRSEVREARERRLLPPPTGATQRRFSGGSCPGYEDAIRCWADGARPVDIARRLGIGRASVYRGLADLRFARRRSVTFRLGEVAVAQQMSQCILQIRHGDSCRAADPRRNRSPRNCSSHSSGG